MNCDECRERILDLIEREEGDPDAVRKLLERCPDCRALFDQMKGLLEEVAALPVEEPTAAVDQAILSAARARAGGLHRPRSRTLRAPHWAAAAVALLAIGVGVWAIPRGTERVASTRMDAPVDAELERGGAADQAVADDGPVPPPTPSATLAEASFEAEPVAAAPEPRRRKSAGRPPAGRTEPPVAEADGLRSPPRSANSVVSEEAMEAAALTKSRASEAAPGSKALPCERRRVTIERQDRDATAEEALWLGSCYREAGDWRRARGWFERAASDPSTRARAKQALKTLPSE